MIQIGNTQVLCTASISTDVPKWLTGTNSGWITAEYGMLPRATHTRNKREAASGKQSGRTVEIQRLIGRSLRAAVDLTLIPETLITIDCDVLVADGGTRTASITGGWIALAHALNSLVKKRHAEGTLHQPIPIMRIAALSSGILDGQVLVDLCYEEDSQAGFDANIILDASHNIIEFQGTAERERISFPLLSELHEKTAQQIEALLAIQAEQCSELSFIEVR